jgi:hypothetical protein
MDIAIPIPRLRNIACHKQCKYLPVVDGQTRILSGYNGKGQFQPQSRVQPKPLAGKVLLSRSS